MPKLGEAAFLHQIASGDVVMALHGREPEVLAGFGHRIGGSEKGCVGAAQGIGIEADPGGEDAGASAKAERQGDAILRLPGQHKDGCAQITAAGFDRDDILGRDAEACRGIGRDQRGIVPGQAREGSRQFQKPGIIGMSAVTHGVIGAKQKRDPTVLLLWGRQACGEIAFWGDRYWRRCAVGDKTETQRLMPELLEIRTAALLRLLLPMRAQQRVIVGRRVAR